MAEPARHGRARLRRLRRRIQLWAGRALPPGARLAVGLLLMLAGVFGFLPVIGFWMFPLGLAVAALDIKALCRLVRRRRGPRHRARPRRGGE
ncbi:MAG: hypothetical protein Kow0058_00430 [Roseovarius sp.]